MGRWLALLLLPLLAACGAAPAAPRASGLQVHAVSATATAVPSPAAAAVGASAPAASATPAATPTSGPVVYTLDFTTERRHDVTLHVGQSLKLDLAAGPNAGWISGVDDARVLRPMSPGGTGVYQAVRPGTALLTAHLPFGCAKVAPAVPCRTPEHGLWFQTRVYVVA